MKGLNAFEMAHMKHRDTRVFMLCQHLRTAIDVMEQIASEPFQPPPKAKPETPAATTPTMVEIPPDKLTYTVKEASAERGQKDDALACRLRREAPRSQGWQPDTDPGGWT